jgi:small subunit ribosomal protein S5
MEKEKVKEFEERVVQVCRVTKVVTGGKRLAFRVLAVVGDKKGRVGMGISKANEVASAIRKAVETAKNHLIKVPLVGNTVPHRIVGKLGASEVLIRPAPAGRGVIAGGAVRIILELAGIKDAVAKSLGASSAINVAQATLNGLENLRTVEEEEKLRNKKLEVRFVQEDQNA